MSKEYKWENVWAEDSYALPETRERKAARKLERFREHGIDLRNLGRVVELGCGGADFITKLFKEQSSIQSYLGIDRSPTALSRAKKAVEEFPCATFHLGDVSEIPVDDNSVDTVIVLGVIEHIRDAESLFSEIERVSRPGATLIMSASNVFSFMYLARKVRELLGIWPYGYQKNESVSSLRKLLGRYACKVKISTLHGDSDFPLITKIDKFFGMFLSNWGRYVLVTAELRGGA